MFRKRKRLQQILQEMEALSGEDVNNAKQSRFLLREAMTTVARRTWYADLIYQIDTAYSQFGMRRDAHGYQEKLATTPDYN